MVNHHSVEEEAKGQKKPIDLNQCLKAFTTEEELGEDGLYYCGKCKKHQLAKKKLDIWRWPPILVRNTIYIPMLSNCATNGGIFSVV